MITFKITGLLNNKPVFNASLDEIFASCPVGGRLEIYDVEETITEQQRKWYRGVCLKYLSEWNGDTIDEWDYRLKMMCGGNELLRKERIYMGNNRYSVRLSISSVSMKNMTQFIENILSMAITENWPITPPQFPKHDPDLEELEKFTKPPVQNGPKTATNAQESTIAGPADIPAEERYFCPTCDSTFPKPAGFNKDLCPKLHKGIVDRWAKPDKQ